MHKDFSLEPKPLFGGVAKLGDLEMVISGFWALTINHDNQVIGPIVAIFVQF